MGETGSPVLKRVHFNAFEVDRSSGELLQGGRRVPLQELPFQLLCLLLERPGQVVTREEIREALWPKGTFVDFDDGLNTAVRKLRLALGDSAEQPIYIETLPKRGYRFIVPLTNQQAHGPGMPGIPRTGGPSNTAPASPEEAPARGTVHGRRAADRLKGRILLVSITLLAGVAGALAWQRSIRNKPPAAQRAIMVLPVENLMADPRQAYIADGAMEELTTGLSSLPGLRVVSRGTAMLYRGTTKPARKIAEEMAVDRLVESALMKKGDQYHMTVKLLGKDGLTQWAANFEGPEADLFGLLGRVSAAIGEQVRPPGSDPNRVSPVHAVKPEAYDAYLQGLRAEHEYTFSNSPGRGGPDPRKAYEKAVTLDPGYARAQAALARMIVKEGVSSRLPPSDWDLARASASRAIQLDPTLGEAQAALGVIRGMLDWNWAEAEQAYQRALKLAPTSGWVRSNHAWQLRALGRHEEALQEIRQASKLDPLSKYFQRSEVGFLESAGRLDEALVLGERMRPGNTSPVLENRLFEICMFKGQPERAMAYAAAGCDLNPTQERAIKARYRQSGARGIWKFLLELALREDERTHYAALLVAELYAVLGEKDEAFYWLEKAYERREPFLCFLRGEPEFKDLSQDPRYHDLLKRMNLE